MKLTFFSVLGTVIEAFVLAAVILFAVSPASCSLSKDGIRVITCDSVPELLSFSAESATKIKLVFDRNIHFENLRVHETESSGTPVACSCDCATSEKEKVVTLERPACVGKSYTVDGLVCDENRNTLLFSIDFKGFNDNRAGLLITEVRNAYSSKTNQYEYVKFYCTKSGNLSGYEFFTAGDGEQKKFEFPSIMVQEGEFVTVHLRKMKGPDGMYIQDGMIDETEGDKTASYAIDSSVDSWDFWVDNQKSRISPSDIIILRNADDGRVCDVLLLADARKAAEDWNAKYEFVRTLVEQSGLWLDDGGFASGALSSAVVCTGITSSAVNRMICRKNFAVPSCASDWYIRTVRKKR